MPCGAHECGSGQRRRLRGPMSAARDNEDAYGAHDCGFRQRRCRWGAMSVVSEAKMPVGPMTAVSVKAGSPPHAQTTAPSQGLPNALPLTLAPDPPGGVCTRTRHAKTRGPRPKRKQPRLHKVCQTRFQRPWHPTPQVVFAPGPAMQNVGSPPQARTTVPSQGLSNALPLTLAPDPPGGVSTRTRHAKMRGLRPKREQPRPRKVCQTRFH